MKYAVIALVGFGLMAVSFYGMWFNWLYTITLTLGFILFVSGICAFDQAGLNKGDNS